MRYRAIIKKKAGWWIGWLIDLPGVNAQERTHEELMRSLAIGAQEMLESEVDFEAEAQMVVVDVPDPAWASTGGESLVAESHS
jgi:predicted RNase H-like HicB family nuclease